MRALLLIIAMAIALPLSAQVEQSVEVTRDYIPQLPAASKPSLRAEIVDTTTIRPEVDYTIAPLSISTSLATTPIDATQITYWQSTQSDNIAMKVGLGAMPLLSLFDGYYSRYSADKGYFLGSVNHYGEYDRIIKSSGVKSCENKVSSRVGIAGGLFFGVRSLDMGFSYDSYIDCRNAAQILEDKLARISYQDVDFSLRFGDDFIDLSRWNFSIDADFEHFWDRYAHYNTQLGGGVKVAKEFGEAGGVTLLASYDYIKAKEGVNRHGVGVLDVDFLYSYSSRGWGVVAGVIYKDAQNQYVDHSGVAHDAILLTPQAELSYSRGSSYKLFVRYGGDMSLGDYSNVAQINPYIANDDIFSLRSTRYYNLQLGVEGVPFTSSQFSYKAYAEWSRANDDRLYLLVVDATNGYNYMATEYINQSTLSLNVEAEYRPISQVVIGVDAHLNHYAKEFDEDGYAIGKPKFNSTFRVDYNHSRFSIGARANCITARDVSYIYSGLEESVRLPATVDLDVNFECKVVSSVSLFLEANNIFNQEIYKFYGYQDLGVNFMAGVKISF